MPLGWHRGGQAFFPRLITSPTFRLLIKPPRTPEPPGGLGPAPCSPAWMKEHCPSSFLSQLSCAHSGCLLFAVSGAPCCSSAHNTCFTYWLSNDSQDALRNTWRGLGAALVPTGGFPALSELSSCRAGNVHFIFKSCKRENESKRGQVIFPKATQCELGRWLGV